MQQRQLHGSAPPRQARALAELESALRYRAADFLVLATELAIIRTQGRDLSNPTAAVVADSVLAMRHDPLAARLLDLAERLVSE